jgi:uncharacterized protein YukE
MAKKWEEIKAVCDDPSVPADKKQALLSAYVGENSYPQSRAMGAGPTYVDGTKLPKDAQEYVKAYDAYPAWGKTTDDAYKDAKDAGDQAGYNDREHKKQVDAGKMKLAGQQPPGEGGTGTKTSDELFDAATASLKMFEDFVPLLGKLPEDCKGNTKPLNFETDIKKRFDEQRGISFQKFIEDADRFAAGATSVEGTMTDTNTQLSTLFGTWQGKAADSASKHYDDKIAKNAKTVHANLTGSSTAIHTAVTTVYQLCKGKADAVNKSYTSTVGKADKAMAETVINIANDSHAGKDEMGRVAGWMDTNFGTNLRKALNDDGCCDDDDIKKEGIRLAKQWIQKHFNPDLWDNLYTGFVKNCDDTKKFVDQAWDSLDKIMGEIENGFEGVKETAPPQNTQPSHDTGGNGHSGGSGSGGGGTPASATTPSTADPNAQHKPADGMNPVTGKPLEVDPTTGQPYPIDPKTGEALKHAGHDQDKMTVEKGDNKITMTEPDKAGKMGISVDNGTGQHKDYKLDFGEKADGAKADHKPGEFGPQGVKDGAPGADGAYKPGPDGKIHIQDGNFKITAEQPQGHNGPTVVTVDDGKGEPTKYTLAEKDPDKAGLKTDDSKPGEGKPTDPKLTPAGHHTGAADANGSGDAKLAGVHTMAASAAGFSASGGLNLHGDFAPAAGHDGVSGDLAAATGDTAGGAGAGAGKTELASSGGEFFSGGASGDAFAAMGGLGDSVNLHDGAHTGSDAPQAAAEGGLGAAPGGMDPSAGQQPVGAGAAGAGAGGMGGMAGMMGGMGGMGGGGGGDQQRGSSQYKVDGAIFETSGSRGRISGSLDDEGDRSIRYDR